MVSVAKSFGNVSGIEYSLYPGTDETSGNCNTSSTTLLSKAGVSDKQIHAIKKKMAGICWGFGSKKAWTKEEQTKAVQDKKNVDNSQAREKVRRYEALQMAL